MSNFLMNDLLFFIIIYETDTRKKAHNHGISGYAPLTYKLKNRYLHFKNVLQFTNVCQEIRPQFNTFSGAF